MGVYQSKYRKFGKKIGAQIDDCDLLLDFLALFCHIAHTPLFSRISLGKTPVLESYLKRVAAMKACNFIKK